MITLLQKIKNKKLLVAGGLIAVVLGVFVVISLSTQEAEYTLADYLKKIKKGKLGTTGEIENLYQGEAREFSYKPRHGQTLQVSFEIDAKAMVNINYLVASMNVSSGTKKIDDDKSLKALFGKKEETQIHNSGTLHLKFFRKDKTVWNVAAVIKNLEYLVNGEKTTLEKALAQAFAFEMSNKGFFNHFKFMKGIPAHIQRIMKQLVYSMQVATPKGKKNTWKMKEFDAEGYYLALYGVTSLDDKNKKAEITKRKVKYIDTYNFGKKSTILRTLREGKKEVGLSLGKIVYPYKGAWFESFSSHDSDVSKSRGGTVWGEGEYSFEAKNLHSKSSYPFGYSFKLFLKKLNSGSYLKYKYYETDPLLSAMGQGKNIKGAIDVYKELLKKKKTRSLAEKFIVNYLRMYPDKSEDWLKYIDGVDKSELSEKRQHTMWRLLSKAGHSEAQHAMSGAYNDDYNLISNYRAVSYTHDFENPEPFLVDDLLTMHNRLKNDSNMDSKELSTMSILAIGSLGNKDKLNEETRVKSANVLKNYLAVTKDKFIKNDVLLSMGNHGGKMLLETLKPFLTSSEKTLKQSAYHALRHMEEAAAQETLLTFYPKEKDNNIKAGAIIVLSKMPYREETFNFIKGEVGFEKNESVRLTIARYLGKNIDKNEEAKILLAELAKKSKSIKTKTEIYKYIVP